MKLVLVLLNVTAAVLDNKPLSTNSIGTWMLIPTVLNSTAFPAFANGDTSETVFDSALVDVTVQIACPKASVAGQALGVFKVPVIEYVGTIPETELLLMSFNVTVTSQVSTPSAIVGVAARMVELATTAGPAMNVTVPSALSTGLSIESVFIPATVEERVQVDSPLREVAEQIPYVFGVPVAEKVGTSPAIGALLTSLRVIVIVEVEVPFATTGVAVPVMVEFAATGDPVWKRTVPPALTKGVAIERVFSSPVVEDIVQVEIPVALETEQAP